MKKHLSLFILLCIICSTFSFGCDDQTEKYYTSMADLAGTDVCTWPGSRAEDLILEEYPEINPIYLGEISVMQQAVQTGKMAALAFDQCFEAVSREEGLNMTAISDFSVPFDVAFIFPDTDKGFLLKEEMNNFLYEASSSGLLKELQDYWIKSGKTYESGYELNSWPGEKGTLTIASSGSGVPFEYYFNNEISGYEYALLCEFGKARHYHLELQILEFDAVLTSVTAGQADIGFNNIEMTDERKEILNFSDPVYRGTMKLFTLQDPLTLPQYSSIEELKDLPAGLLQGSIDDIILDEWEMTGPRHTFNVFNDVLVAIKEGKVAYSLMERVNYKVLSSSMEGLALLDQSLFTEHFGAVFKKNDDKAFLLKNQFNEFLKEYINSGQRDLDMVKWMDHTGTATLEERNITGEQGTLTVAMSGEIIPFCFLNDGKFEGFEIDMIYAFCEKYGYKPEISIMDFGALIPAVNSKKVDMAVSTLAYTEERAQSVDFSDSYFDEELCPVVKTRGIRKDPLLQRLKTSFYKTFVLEARWKMILSGVEMTVLITLLSAVIGTVLGFLVYMYCRKGAKIPNLFFDGFSRLLGGLPMVVVLMILYYIIFAKSSISNNLVCIIGFSASIALQVYSGLKVSVKAIDNGQLEGAYSLGFTDLHAFFSIILPQALEQFIPRYKGMMIALINGTAVVGYIAVQDLTKASDIIRARTYEAFFPLIATALIYFVLGMILTGLVKRLELNFNPENRSVKKIKRQFNK